MYSAPITHKSKSKSNNTWSLNTSKDISYEIARGSVDVIWRGELRHCFNSAAILDRPCLILVFPQNFRKAPKFVEFKTDVRTLKWFKNMKFTVRKLLFVH